MGSTRCVADIGLVHKDAVLKHLVSCRITKLSRFLLSGFSKAQKPIRPSHMPLLFVT
jgi:hypothetical protein